MNFNLPVFRVLPLFLLKRVGNNELIKNDYSFFASVLLLLIAISLDWFRIGENQEFNDWNIVGFIGELFLLTIFLYLVYKSQDTSVPINNLFSLIVEVWVVIKVLEGVSVLLIDKFYPEFEYFDLLATLLFGAEIFAVSGLFLVCFSRNIITSNGYVVCYIALVIAPVAFFDVFNIGFWYEGYDENKESSYYENYKYDEILYKQDDLVKESLSKVEKSEPGKVEMYYLGFASYASENVFKNEVEYISKLFSDNFYNKNRGINLVNHRDTIDNQPLAIKRNLELALSGLAKKMGKEDILFLYLTSHGSADHELSVNFYPFKLTDITPSILRKALDDSGIKWRVLVVSACYSGGFIDDLKTEYTLIATAASAEDKSFGCGDASEFTYYGEALFKDNLSKEKPIVDSFFDAVSQIEKREKTEGKDASNPQLWLGEKVKVHLELFQKDLNF